MAGIPKRFTIAIEAAVNGGSLALFRGGELVASESGDGSVSRAEDLLPAIAAVLGASGGKVQDLERIVVSRGPGSFTGIRIGLATAMGLSRSLGIPVIGVPLLNAIAAGRARAFPALVAVQLSRADAAWQEFPSESSIYDTASAAAVSISSLGPMIGNLKGTEVIMPFSLHERSDIASDQRIDLIRDDLACFLGRSADLWDPGEIAPLYLQNPERSRNLF